MCDKYALIWDRNIYIQYYDHSHSIPNCYCFIIFFHLSLSVFGSSSKNRSNQTFWALIIYFILWFHNQNVRLNIKSGWQYRYAFSVSWNSWYFFDRPTMLKMRLMLLVMFGLKIDQNTILKSEIGYPNNCRLVFFFLNLFHFGLNTTNGLLWDTIAKIHSTSFLHAKRII